MQINKYEVWIADLNPQVGTETGKFRPVLIVQGNLLNSNNHKSTVICPITSNVVSKASILRVIIAKGLANLEIESEVIIDQLRSIDNSRLKRKIGDLPMNLRSKVTENIQIILEIGDDF